MTPEMMTALTKQVAELVQTYSDNYQQFQQATYNETQVRVDFVNRFFKFLGWDVNNERGLPQHLREVTHEATVVVEEDGVYRSKKPDYSFKVGTEVLYFLETKKPAVNLTVDAAPAFQLRRYGWSGNLKISVLTNFTDLYIYDCSVRPREGDDIGVAMIAHYHFNEYVEHFEEIFNMLSKEAVLTGQFERQFGNIQGALRREPFDQYFLDQIRTWRTLLGEDILSNNPEIDVETLNIFVQKILNRTIFLRICEDRCFENYESLRAITTYQELKTMFIAADQKYDSGLFELLEEDQLTVSDAVIIEIFQSLYYPNNSYEFSVIDPYIIGQIYELFLQLILVLNRGLSFRKILLLIWKRLLNHAFLFPAWSIFLLVCKLVLIKSISFIQIMRMKISFIRMTSMGAIFKLKKESCVKAFMTHSLLVMRRLRLTAI